MHWLLLVRLRGVVELNVAVGTGDDVFWQLSLMSVAKTARELQFASDMGSMHVSEGDFT